MQELIKQFDFNGQSIRVITNDKDQVFFVAKDICDVLGYSNTSKDISDNCKKDGVTSSYITDELGRLQNTTIINEGNLYRLVLKSKKKESETFESWVCDEVLPSIRKTGKYEQQPKELSRKDLALMVIQAEEENERLQAQVKKLEPKAEYADKVLSSKDAMVTTVIAGDLGMSAIKMNRELRDRGIIRKVGGQWQLTAKYCNKGYATTRIHVREDKETGEIHNDRLLVWTEYGKAFIHSLFNKKLSFSKASNNSVSTTYRQPSISQ